MTQKKPIVPGRKIHFNEYIRYQASDFRSNNKPLVHQIGQETYGKT